MDGTAALLDRLSVDVCAADNAVRIESLDGDELLAAVAAAERLAERVGLLAARLAGRVASSFDADEGSVTFRGGHLSPESLLRSRTGVGFRDTSQRIRVGRLLDVRPESEFAPLVPAVTHGKVSGATAEGISRILTPIVDHVDSGALRDAVSRLADIAPDLHSDDIIARARDIRDSLDRFGVPDREAELRAQRSLRRGRVIDGLRRVTLLLDPESDAIVSGALDAVLSPRLGGPRFTVDSADGGRVEQRAGDQIGDSGVDSSKRADAVADSDDRTLGQAGLDALVDLVRLGAAADPNRMPASARPLVRVTVAADDLLGPDDDRSAPGVTWLEGHDHPLSIGSARRLACEANILPLVLGGASEPLDLGHQRRLFSAPQRHAMAVRDGGCLWPDCDRPPSWTEAHHIHGVASHRGRTDLAEGVLLCRRHHLLLHNDGWAIRRGHDPGRFELIPPISIDVGRRPRPLRSKRPGWALAGPSA